MSVLTQNIHRFDIVAFLRNKHETVKEAGDYITTPDALTGGTQR